MPTSSLLKQLISSSMMAGLTIFGLAVARPANAESLVRDGMIEDGTLAIETQDNFFIQQSPASAALINFDTDANGNPISAPCLFIETTRLTELYAPLGVHFSGPGGNNGGAILNECGNFGVSALSGSNFLAFNRDTTLSDGGVPTDPETISFDMLLTSFSIFAASGSGTNTFGLQAFDINDLLVANDTVTTSSGTWSQLSVSSDSGNISRVVLTGIGSDNAFVYDNLSFTPASTSVPEPNSMAGLLAISVFGVGYSLRRKQQQKA
jgi:hypothetical protein